MGQSRASGSELFLQQDDGSFVKKEQKYFSDSQLVPFKDMGSLFWMLIQMETLICMLHPVDMIHPFVPLSSGPVVFESGAGDFVLGLPNTLIFGMQVEQLCGRF